MYWAGTATSHIFLDVLSEITAKLFASIAD
jgi:hypothetical protein